MHNYKELKIWLKSRELATLIYKLSTKLPSKEKYGLISQIQRASISIPANIAEGSGRSSNKDFSRFLDISMGSAFELETEIYILHDLEYINEIYFNEYLLKVQEIQKMIYAFRETLVK